MAKFVPFRPPPPPVPFNEAGDIAAAPAQIKEREIKQRAWSTSVVVIESTDASGMCTYSTKAAPMVEIVAPAGENLQGIEQVEVRQPFLRRMTQRQYLNNRNRGILQRPDMQAISVKRQRKLKMKKHKYKKLMKRTRLERRKLDRT